jgi:hypothetical protein
MKLGDFVDHQIFLYRIEDGVLHPAFIFIYLCFYGKEAGDFYESGPRGPESVVI